MLYLRTGANGSGKTLLTLKDVRELQLKTGRPVMFNLRPADHPEEEKRNTPYCNLKPETIEEFGWKGFHFKDWEAQQDGTIFIVDECHYDLPTRPAGQKPPEHIQRLTEHRSRGFDFFLLTQHPKNFDVFVRNIVGAPGWHQHIKRLGGAMPVANFLQWDSVNLQCEQFGSGKNSQVQTRPYPREVYGWYKSAELHTGKVRIPRQVWYIVFGSIGAVVLMVSAFKQVGGGAGAQKKKDDKNAVASLVGGPVGDSTASTRPKTAGELVASYAPRIRGLAHTAPAYDELTKPKRVPVPAACMQMADRCKCYTQDATSYTTTLEICRQIVSNGLWLDFAPEGGQGAGQQAQYAPARHGGPVAPVSAPAPAPAMQVIDATASRTNWKDGGQVASSASSGQPGQVDQAQPQPRVPANSPWSFKTGG